MPAASERSPRSIQRFLRSLELGHFGKWVLLSSLVGVLAGLTAAGFKWGTRFLSLQVFQPVTGVSTEGVGQTPDRWWLLILVPALGGLITGVLIYRFAPETEGHGTDSVIRAYHRLRGVIRARVILLKALTSAITIGSGGSAGQEGPVAQVGAGVGSSLANVLHLSNRDRRIFLLAGASAGVGAMFGSPLGGALFMPEVLYGKAEFEGEAIIPCIIASIMSYTTLTTISGAHRAVEIQESLLSRLSFDDPRQLLIYLVLGVLCAIFGWIYTKVFYGTHALFERATFIPRWSRPALGGALLGVLALSLTRQTGEYGILFGGYGLMHAAIASKLGLSALLILALAKILATSLTISSGGSGGVFAPALSIGALIGAMVGQFAQAHFPELVPEAASFALVGMGGFFAGVAKVPIASVVMVTEMTGGYDLLAPLMLVAVVSLLLSRKFTMYRAQVASQIDSPAHAGDFVVDVLESMRVREVVGEVRPPRVIHEDVTLRGAMRIVADSHETHFPVVDDEDKLVGIFSLTDLRRIFLEEVVEDVIIVRDFMKERVITATMDDSLGAVLRQMTRANINSIPVVDETGHKVLCLLERNTLGKAYADKLERMRKES